MSDTDEIRRHVAWWYRARVKSPPDTITALAAEAGCSERTIAAGIADAQEQLDTFDRLYQAGRVSIDFKPRGDTH